MHKNKHVAFSILVAVAILLASCGGGKPNYKVSLKKEADSVSYFFGYYLGIQLSYAEFEKIEDVKFNALAKGLKEAIENGKKVDEQKMQELQMYLTQFMGKMQSKASEKALKEGQDFLEANKKKQGVVTLPSGLQYKIITEGTGIKPTIEDVVDIFYHGTLIDGTEFDGNKDDDKPLTFPVSNFVPGFSEALTLMNEGSVWEVYIPSELGYGERANQRIPANSVLIFEINMVKVNKGDK